MIDLVKKKKKESVFSLFDEIIINEERISHRAQTFCGLIIRCAKLGHIQSATKVFYLMHQSSIK